MKTIQRRQGPLSASPAKRISEKNLSFHHFLLLCTLRSSTRGRFPLQFDLIVINGGTDEIF